MMPVVPDRASVKVGTFDPARVFPLDDPLTLPLLRLMLATDDVRHASVLFVMADHQVRHTTGVQQALHAGQMWYLFRLLCSHLHEGGNALHTLLKSVANRRLQDLLRDRAAGTAALERLLPAFGAEAFVTRVRNSIGSHYHKRTSSGCSGASWRRAASRGRLSLVKCGACRGSPLPMSSPCG